MSLNLDSLPSVWLLPDSPHSRASRGCYRVPVKVVQKAKSQKAWHSSLCANRQLAANADCAKQQIDQSLMTETMFDQRSATGHWINM